MGSHPLLTHMFGDIISFLNSLSFIWIFWSCLSQASLYSLPCYFPQQLDSSAPWWQGYGVLEWFMLLAAGYVVGEIGWLFVGNTCISLVASGLESGYVLTTVSRACFNDSHFLLRPLQLFAMLAMSLSDSQMSIVT
jgi:hypothetical protein